MSSTKKFNKETGKWEVFGSTDAIDIKLTDLQGNFTSDNVEGALREASSKLSELTDSIANQKEVISQHSNDIEWLKMYGGGGSGGGGGTAAPTITSTFEDGTIVEKDKDVIIPIFFSSPNMGEGIAYIVIDGVEIDSVTVKQGNNKINIGKLTNLKTEVSIYVKDRANLLSNQLMWDIICGGIDLEINFDSTADYTVVDIIAMQYKVVSASEEPIIMHLTVDYDDYEITCVTGTSEYVFEGLGVGIHKVSLYMTSGPYKTSVYTFNIVVVNSDSLYVSTMFDGGEFEYGYPVAINYRISKASTEQFNIRFLLDDKLVKTAASGVGSYYWTINNVEIGAHTWAIEVTSSQGEFQSISGEFTIIKGEYTPIKTVESGLVYRLNAEGRTNQDSDKENPIDNSGNGVKATLHNFNYYSNGWIDDTLVCDGNSYVEIDYYPWESNAIYGSTIEIQFKGLDIGLSDARIFDYTDIEPPYKGVYIDLGKSVMSSLAQPGEVTTDADTWMTMTYVIDRKNKFGKIFIDGVCSRAFFLSDKGSGTNAVREDFTHSQKIYLNSKKGLSNFGACEIKDLRIYNRALSDDEILQNFIAQEKNFDKQKELNDLNYNNKTLPVIRMYGDMTNMTLETPVTMRIKYTSPNEDKYGQSFDLPYCQVNWQGTSSLQYVLKNFTARLKDENMAPFEYSPYPNGILEDVYCFKADYMESTHSRNAGLAKFVNECLYDEKNPAQQINPNIRNAVNGFPCLMYINDQLQGVYNFNLDRYSTKSYGYTEDTTLVYEVSANSDTTAGAFYKWTEASGKDKLDYYKSDFECLYPPTRAAGNDDMAELIRLVEWVNDSSDEDFKDNMPRYFNLQYLLRYFLYVYVVGAVDSLGKNMKLATWDGLVWYPQVYDADTTLGLDNTGFLKFDMDIEMGDEHVFNTTGSVLWRRVRELFKAELEAQYAIMRQKHFTVENMMKYLLEEQIQKIPARYYNIDMQTKYLNYESSYLYALHGSGEHHIRKWLRERILYCDTLFNYTTTTSDYITLRSSKLGHVYLDIQTYIPMYLRVKWRDEANNTGVQVKRIGRGETVRFEYNMPTATDQEIIVYGGHYLKSIGDVSNLEPTTMLIANADRLTEIECHSPNLINTDLSVCTKLQRIDISNSPALGTGIGAQPTLNIQNCKYLKYCNCYNTSLTAIYTMQEGGNLEELYYPATTQVVQITNQTHLKRLGLPANMATDEYCRNLQTVQITNCNKIQTLHYPFNENDDIDFSPFKYVQDIAITNSIDRLTFMSFSGFNKLKTLKLQSLKNLVEIGFDDMLGINDESAFKSIIIADTPQIPQVNFNVSDPERYKIAFAENAVLDFSGMYGMNTLNSNAEGLQGLKRILVPISIKNIHFSAPNNVKSIITGSSSHIADSNWEGYDLAGAELETCDLSGLKIKHAENFNLAPVRELPIINKDKDPAQYIVPMSGTYNLTNYVGTSLDGAFEGFDFSTDYTFKCDAVLDKITNLNNVFKSCKVEAVKLNKILEKLPNLTSMVSTFESCINLPNPEILNIPNSVTDFSYCFKGSDIEQDIAFKPNVLNVTGAFESCDKLSNVTKNWELTYDNTVISSDCYAKCNAITQFNGEDISLTKYETGRDRIPVEWGGNNFRNEDTGIYEITTTSANSRIVILNNACLLDTGRIDWGDGTVTDGALYHTYTKPGTYIIKGKVLLSDGIDKPTDSIVKYLTKILKVPSQPVNYKNMFRECKNLVYADLSECKCTNLSRTFYGCTNLKTVIFGDLTQCEDFEESFYNCTGLTDVENLLIDEACTRLNGTFYSCSSLTNLKNMNLWNLTNVTTIEKLFEKSGISNFAQVKEWDLSSCSTVKNCFSETPITEIDLSEWIIGEKPAITVNFEGLFRGCVNLQKANVTNLISSSVPNIGYMFYGCSALNNIIGLTSWDTSKVAIIHGLFNSVPITELDVTGWDFSSITYTPNDLWGRNTNEKTIILNNIKWKTPKQINEFLYSSSASGNSKVSKIVMDEIREDMTDFGGMFRNCGYLYEDIRLPIWATNVAECFKNCAGMREIVSNWNNSYFQLTNYTDCYANTNIFKIDGVKDKATSIPEDWGGLAFTNEDSLVVEIDTSLLNISPGYPISVSFTTTNTGAILWGDESEEDLTIASALGGSSFKHSHAYAEHGTYTVKIKSPRLARNEGNPITEIFSIPGNNRTNTSSYGIRNSFAYASDVGLINTWRMNINNILDNKSLSTCKDAFADMPKLTSIVGLNKINFSNIKDMSNMFKGCSLLTGVDMTNWDISNVTNRTDMFTNCNSLTNLNMTNVKLGSNLSGLFYGANNLIVINGLDSVTFKAGTRVTNTSNMFYNCTQLPYDTIKQILSKITFSDSVNASKMFNNVLLSESNITEICSMIGNITSIDILGRQSELTNISILKPILDKCSFEGKQCEGLFEGWSKLTDISILSSYDFKNITSLNNMFKDCIALSNISSLASMDVSSVEDMSYLFYNCKQLTSLEPLRNWKTGKVKLMKYTFAVDGYSGLTTLEPLKDWNVSSVTDMTSMFGAAGGYGYSDTSCKDASALINWDVRNVTHMSRLFEGFRLQDYEFLKSWNIASLQKADYLFAYHWLMEADANRSLDLSTWDVKNVDFGYAGPLFNGRYLINFIPFKNINDDAFYIDGCSNLSVESLVAIFNNLTTTFSVKKIIIGQQNMDKLTDEQLFIALEKGWTVA